MTLAVFPGISPCNSHTLLDMGLKLLARACPQNIIKVIKYFSYWVNWSDVVRSQSSNMGQNDPYRPSSVNKKIIYNSESETLGGKTKRISLPFMFSTFTVQVLLKFYSFKCVLIFDLNILKVNNFGNFYPSSSQPISS